MSELAHTLDVLCVFLVCSLPASEHCAALLCYVPSAVGSLSKFQCWTGRDKIAFLGEARMTHRPVNATRSWWPQRGLRGSWQGWCSPRAATSNDRTPFPGSSSCPPSCQVPSAIASASRFPPSTRSIPANIPCFALTSAGEYATWPREGLLISLPPRAVHKATRKADAASFPRHRPGTPLPLRISQRS